MPMTFPIKQDHVANLKPKGRRSKRYGVQVTQTFPKRKKRGRIKTSVTARPAKIGKVLAGFLFSDSPDSLPAGAAIA